MTLDILTNESLNLASASMTLAQVNPIVINLLVGLFLLISIVMILIVLIQRPQGGGLGGAFGAGGSGGGGGAGQTAFGTKTGDVLTGGTIAIFVLFITFAIILNFVTRPPEAQPEQPTIAAPATTEPIPLDESEEIDPDADPSALDVIEDTGEEALDQAEEVVDDLTEEVTEPATDPATDPPGDPAGTPESDE